MHNASPHSFFPPILALEILVSPKQQIVGEATPVSYECLVVGNLVSSISWARDFETLSPEKVRVLNGSISVDTIDLANLSLLCMQYNIQTGVFGENDKGLRLTFLSPRLNDSGVYVCSAFNQFEKVQNTVDLAVFPPGMRSPSYTVSNFYIYSALRKF